MSIPRQTVGLVAVMAAASAGVGSCGSRRAPGAPPAAQAEARTDVRRALERRYEENRQALLARDFDRIMRLRTADFHSVTPDGVRHDRPEMEQFTRALVAGIDRWIALSFEIDSLDVRGPEASAWVRQHAARMARRPDGQLHHVENWVTQREVWRWERGEWLLHRVDGIRDQRRLIDGRAG